MVSSQQTEKAPPPSGCPDDPMYQGGEPFGRGRPRRLLELLPTPYGSEVRCLDKGVPDAGRGDEA